MNANAKITLRTTCSSAPHHHHLEIDYRGPIYKESYDNLTINLRQIVSYEHLTTCLMINLREVVRFFVNLAPESLSFHSQSKIVAMYTNLTPPLH